jgi:uncharacterized protein YjbI with pentapeptide repeats
MAGAAETLRAALADLERREGQLEERMRTVDVECQELLAATKALASEELKEVDRQHEQCMKVQGEALARLKNLRGQVAHGRSGRVKLSVGGSVFETTISTLTKFPDTFFYAAFVSFHPGEPAPPDADGCYYIDRDGKHFGTILDFLRTGRVRFPADDGDIKPNGRGPVLQPRRTVRRRAGCRRQHGGQHRRQHAGGGGSGAKAARRPDLTLREVLLMVAAGHNNFTGCNLIGLNLSSMDLTRANLTNSILSHVDLTGANLAGADLTRADMLEANLSWADLAGAKLVEADLTRANLTRADLIGADLTHVELSGAILTDAYDADMTQVI